MAVEILTQQRKPKIENNSIQCTKQINGEVCEQFNSADNHYASLAYAKALLSKQSM
jgi:hypothetical protein